MLTQLTRHQPPIPLFERTIKQFMKIYTQRLDPAALSAKQQAVIDDQKQAQHFLYLDFDTRQRSRFKAQTQQQQAVGIDLPRTETIKNGSVLANNQGELIQVMAAKQALIKVTADNSFDADTVMSTRSAERSPGEGYIYGGYGPGNDSR